MPSDHEINRPMPWVRVATIGALASIVLSGFLYVVGLGVLATIAIVGVITFLVILYFNPKYYLLRISSALIGLGASTTVAPEFAGELAFLDIGSIEIKTSPFAGPALLFAGLLFSLLYYFRVHVPEPKVLGSNRKTITQTQKGGRNSRNLQIISAGNTASISQEQDGKDGSINKQGIKIRE